MASRLPRILWLSLVVFVLVGLGFAVSNVSAKTTWRYNYCSTNCSHGSQAPTYECGKSAGYQYYVTGGDAIIDRKWRTTRGLNEKMRKCCTKEKGHKACTFLHSDGVDWAKVFEVTAQGLEAAGTIAGGKQ